MSERTELRPDLTRTRTKPRPAGAVADPADPADPATPASAGATLTAVPSTTETSTKDATPRTGTSDATGSDGGAPPRISEAATTPGTPAAQTSTDSDGRQQQQPDPAPNTSSGSPRRLAPISSALPTIAVQYRLTDAERDVLLRMQEARGDRRGIDTMRWFLATFGEDAIRAARTSR